MNWFEVLRLAEELLAAIIPIIGSVLGNGEHNIDPSRLPTHLREKIVKLAERIKESR